MGISGLLPLLKSIQKPSHVKKFAGQTLGVDTYGWLHKGVIGCATELALGKPTRKHIDYVLFRVRLLLHFGVKPYLVFDGDRLPSKAKTEESRRERRQQAKEEGERLLKAGNNAEAYKTLQKAIDVTPQMSYELIQELKKLNVQYVVAPYEADAQLAYLERKGIINGVLSEDSDLLVFGVRRLLTKLDSYGACIEVNRNEFTACRDISLIGWTDADFRCMAILSGCDYLDNLPQMGLKTAYRLVRRHKAIDKILRAIQFNGTVVPPEYAANFIQAERSFLHHLVFCPNAKELVHLNDLPKDLKEEDMPYLGTKTDSKTAQLVALGDVDPMTKERILPRCNPKSSKTPISNKMLLNGENRRHTFGTTEELKDNKKINTFFKKRMPLAELDPNSLTPSPSQQRLLELHANASWVATPSPSPMVRGSQSTPRGRRETEMYLAGGSAPSEHNKPIKRQRLCSDSEGSIAEDAVSPFFAKQHKAISGTTPGKIKKARRSTFGIFSDDSVDELLLQLPDTPTADGSFLSVDEPERLDSTAKSVETKGQQSDIVEAGDELEPMIKNQVQDLELPQDDVDLVPTSSPVRGNTELHPSLSTETSSSTDIFTSQEGYEVSQSTTSTSFGLVSESESFSDLLDYHVKKESIRGGLKKFSYQAAVSTSQDAAVKTLSNTPVSGKAAHKPVRPQTPLQQLGRSAIRKSQSMSVLSDGKNQNFSQRNATGAMPKPSLPLPRSDSDMTNLATAGGSEDLIVPKSDDEDDDLPPHRPALNLGRFAFQSK